jgi:branched-chain amino acid transport system permease protein
MLPLAVSATTWGQLMVTGIGLGCVYALVAAGFNITYNATGLINFAQGNFVIIGGLIFFTASTTWNLPHLPAALVAVLLTGAMGAVVQFAITGRTRGEGEIGAGIATLGIALLAVAISAQLWGLNVVAVPLFLSGNSVIVGGVAITPQQFLIVGATVAVIVLLWLFFKRTIVGIAMRAASLNRDAARGVGVVTERTAVIAFGLSAALAAIGGVLVTPLAGADPVAGAFIFTLKGFAAAALGGLGSFPGAIFGGLALGLVESCSAAYIGSSWQGSVPFIVLLLIFFLRPGGIVGATVGHRA